MRQPAAGDRRIEILKSAAAAFRRRGYHGASVDEIASALEMTKGNLYYYFKNKEEILFACHEYSLDKLLALMSEVDSEPSTPEEKLRRQSAQQAGSAAEPGTLLAPEKTRHGRLLVEDALCPFPGFGFAVLGS